MTDTKIPNEKEDIYYLIQSLSKSELRQFRVYTKALNKNKKNVYLKLFEEIKDQSIYDEDALMNKLKLSKRNLRDSKFYLFNMILDCLKSVERKNLKVNFLNEMIKFEILKEKGSLKKAIKKYKKLKEIALVNHEFGLLFSMVKQTDILILMNASQDKVIDGRLSKIEELNYYLELSKNLIDYQQLSILVLGLGYKVQDQRIEENNRLLEFLEHPLLAGENMAKSDIAKYIYFEVNCLIYMGVSDYENGSIYALKGYEFLKSIASPYRNDYRLFLASLSNYLHSRLYLKDIDAYERMVLELDELIQNNYDNLRFSMKAKTFAMKTSAVLCYLDITKKYKKFEEIFPELIVKYKIYKNLIHPNFKAGILYNFIKLFFIGKNFERALQWSEELLNEQRQNPSHLYLVCGNILRIMIHFDMGNLKAIPYIANSAEYFLKTKGRYLAIERCFFKGVAKIKPFHSKKEKRELLKKMSLELDLLFADYKNKQQINRMTGMKEWVKSKIQGNS